MESTVSSTRSSCARYFPPTTTIVSSVGSVKLTNGLEGITEGRENEDIYLRLGVSFPVSLNEKVRINSMFLIKINLNVGY